jgi:preprotein translocase subunit SecB
MTEQAATTEQPKFEIQRIYLKDLSLEQPNSPAILFTPDSPQVDIQLALNAEQAMDGFFEVSVTATVTAKQEDKVLFLVEAKQAGLFEIRNVPEDQLSPLMGITCPHIVYPYLRANVADAIQRAGFPPVQLQEINFQAMYQQQMANAEAQQGQA